MGGWLVLAGLISAIGTWATHFIAMLAFDSGMPIYYDPALTLASALVAITLMPFGWWLSLKSSRSTAILAGLLVAAGISTMHYLGMAAMRLSGVLIWDPRIIVVSIVAVAPFSIAAVKLHRRQAGTIPWRPTLALISAICSLHFIGMGSFTIVPGPARLLAGRLLDSNSLVASVLARTVLPVTIGFVVVLFDRLSDREKAAGRIAHLAYHDALTGLSNRSVLETHLSQSVAKAAAAGEPLAVICIDLDGFKAVNDVHWHATGHRLLISVARRLRAIVKDGDLVARTGGDEFIVVQSGGTQPADARAYGQGDRKPLTIVRRGRPSATNWREHRSRNLSKRRTVCRRTGKKIRSGAVPGQSVGPRRRVFLRRLDRGCAQEAFSVADRPCSGDPR